MMTCIALLRGINVGRAKRVAMADLRKLAGDLGYENVRTLLNSGNVVFDATRPAPMKMAPVMEAAIESTFGFTARVVVVTAAELDRIVEENPLADIVTDPSRFLVAFASKATDLTNAATLVGSDWGSDAIALGTKHAYLWCANDILESRLLKAFERVTQKATTTRNWSTVLKLKAMSYSGGAA